ncbi:MAG: hypothetical protein V4674_03350 [Patescibacteria group bacterium]
MERLVRNLVFGFPVLLMTGGLLYLVQFIYYSDASRAYDVMGIIFALVIYSNMVAKMYELTEK